MKFTPRELFAALSAERPTDRQMEIIRAYRVAIDDKRLEIERKERILAERMEGAA